MSPATVIHAYELPTHPRHGGYFLWLDLAPRAIQALGAVVRS